MTHRTPRPRERSRRDEPHIVDCRRPVSADRVLRPWGVRSQGHTLGGGGGGEGGRASGVSGIWFHGALRHRRAGTGRHGFACRRVGPRSGDCAGAWRAGAEAWRHHRLGSAPQHGTGACGTSPTSMDRVAPPTPSTRSCRRRASGPPPTSLAGGRSRCSTPARRRWVCSSATTSSSRFCRARWRRRERR